MQLLLYATCWGQASPGSLERYLVVEVVAVSVCVLGGKPSQIRPVLSGLHRRFKTNLAHRASCNRSIRERLTSDNSRHDRMKLPGARCNIPYHVFARGKPPL